MTISSMELHLKYDKTFIIFHGKCIQFKIILKFVVNQIMDFTLTSITSHQVASCCVPFFVDDVTLDPKNHVEG